MGPGTCISTFPRPVLFLKDSCTTSTSALLKVDRYALSTHSSHTYPFARRTLSVEWRAGTMSAYQNLYSHSRVIASPVIPTSDDATMVSYLPCAVNSPIDFDRSLQPIINEPYYGISASSWISATSSQPPSHTDDLSVLSARSTISSVSPASFPCGGDFSPQQLDTRLQHVAGAGAVYAHDYAAELAMMPPCEYDDEPLGRLSLSQQEAMNENGTAMQGNYLYGHPSVPLGWQDVSVPTSQAPYFALENYVPFEEPSFAWQLQGSTVNRARPLLARPSVAVTEPSHGPLGASPIRPISRRQSSRGRGASQISARTQTRRMPTARICEECKLKNRGGKWKFRGQHELDRHCNQAHNTVTIAWICADPNLTSQQTSSCKNCRDGKLYNTNYNAAEHLRRAHVNADGSPKTSRRTRGGSSGSGASRHSGDKLEKLPTITSLIDSGWMRQTARVRPDNVKHSGFTPEAYSGATDEESSTTDEGVDYHASEFNGMDITGSFEYLQGQGSGASTVRPPQSPHLEFNPVLSNPWIDHEYLAAAAAAQCDELFAHE